MFLIYGCIIENIVKKPLKLQRILYVQLFLMLMLIYLNFYWTKKMKLIKEIESRRDNKGRLRKQGIFWCDFCKSEVKKDIENGLRDKSCGCNKKEIQKTNQLHKSNSNYKHGESATKLYKQYDGMKRRCSYKKHKSYKDYGSRGITVCPEWTNDYIAFRDWALNNGYEEGLQINRRNTITMKIANEIRTLHKTGLYTQQELASIFDITQDQI